jgi:hypothetical protein
MHIAVINDSGLVVMATGGTTYPAATGQQVIQLNEKEKSWGQAFQHSICMCKNVFVTLPLNPTFHQPEQ